MRALRETRSFARWFDNLRDRQARSRILVRLQRLSHGNPGDVQPVGEGVSELRISYGPGYRLYFTERDDALIILVGGDKRTQQRDIREAILLAREL